MNFRDYQNETAKTNQYPELAMRETLVLGLVGEAGEIAQAIKKSRRDGWTEEELKDKMVSELGDVLWYAAELASVLGIWLDDVAMQNVKKLRDRAARGVITGSGDSR